MIDNRMTDKEIIRALGICGFSIISLECKDCPYDEYGAHRCNTNLNKDALDLINRQQAKIDDLTERLNATIAGQETLQKALAEETKNRKVQAERLREEREQKYEQIDLLCRLRNEIADKGREVENLKIENQSLRTAANCYKLHYNEARAEAIRGFAERLKENKFTHKNFGQLVYVEDIDKLVKEMAGEK